MWEGLFLIKWINIYKVRVTLGTENTMRVSVVSKNLKNLCLLRLHIGYLLNRGLFVLSLLCWEGMSQWASCSFVASFYTLRMSAHPASRWEWPGTIVVARAHWSIPLLNCTGALWLDAQFLGKGSLAQPAPGKGHKKEYWFLSFLYINVQIACVGLNSTMRAESCKSLTMRKCLFHMAISSFRIILPISWGYFSASHFAGSIWRKEDLLDIFKPLECF